MDDRSGHSIDKRRKKGGDQIQMTTNSNDICSSVIKTAYGLSLGTLWQHINVACADIPNNYLLRKELFFIILERLLKAKRIRLAENGMFLSGTIKQQIEMLQAVWPLYPSNDENNDLDEYGMWFLVKAPAGIVWLTPEGKELWT